MAGKAGWKKNDILGNIFLLNSPCKFGDSLTILYGDYFKIVLNGEWYFSQTFDKSKNVTLVTNIGNYIVISQS